MIEQSTHITFCMTSPQPRAWLFLKGNHQKPRVVEMTQTLRKVWSASEDLIPDEYLCRYYCGDNLSVSCFGPASVSCGIDSGMDTLLSVKIQN